MSTVKQAFGQRLRRLRTQLDYTQKQMGEAVGIDWSRYHKYELGYLGNLGLGDVSRRQPAQTRALCQGSRCRTQSGLLV
jgi:hypothetical protein